MRKIFIIAFLACVTQMAIAQPAARRQAQQKARVSNADNVTTRARIMFPTAATMPQDVVWRRDIYRELDLTEEANAGLYYPVEPVGNQMNLFTYIFKLMMLRSIPVYEYRLDGNESFEDSAKVKPLAFLDNYQIYYERVNGRIRLDNSDIPSREVKSYYIKESAYYDQATATFHKQVVALCPVFEREDDFGDGATKYPLFWVKYEDLAPFLTKHQMMTSHLNNAAMMSADDFFTRSLYHGKIYKTNNLLGRTLAQYCSSDSAMTKEQKRIEAELAAFEKNLWGDQARKDSLDSIAKIQDKDKVKASKRKNRRADKVKSRRQRSESSVSTPARITVRRERH